MSTSRESRSLVLFIILFFHLCSSSQIPYSPYCSHIVPESTLSDPHTPSPSSFLLLSNAHAANADQLLGSSASLINARFRPGNIFCTQTPHILNIHGDLLLKVSRLSRNTTSRRLYRVYGGPRHSGFAPRVHFRLSGFWSSSGPLCMVGSGQVLLPNSIDGKVSTLNVVLKLNYPNTSAISSCLVDGRLESLDGFFKPISLLGISRIRDDIRTNFTDKSPNRDCSLLTGFSDRFEIEYGGSCKGNKCILPDRLFGYFPKFMSVNVIDCSVDPFVRFTLEFSNSATINNGVVQPFDPAITLVAEGVWNENRNQLTAVACSILMDSSGNASVLDCSVRLNFTLPSVLSVRGMSLIKGQIWSNKSVDDFRYFDKFGFRTSIPKMWGLPDLRYEYTEFETTKRYCSESTATKNKGTNYVDPYSWDMKFDMEVKNDKKQIIRGFVVPIFVDGHPLLNRHSVRFRSKHLDTLNHRVVVTGTPNRGGLVNMSYWVFLNSIDEFELGSKRLLKKADYISAEGMYDSRTGRLCMLGCWTREGNEEQVSNTSAYVDCEISIQIQFPDGGTNGVPQGTIESKRQRTDSLYFERLSLTGTSITKRQAEKSVWRMDLEIIMVLISNTLVCVFLGLQLLHVKNCPQVLPFISVVMLAVLTLGHLVPLLLNFDAFLSNRNRQNVFFATGDWLEINETVVRAIMMIAFLLEARLLQLTWSSRSGNNSLWGPEKMVVYLCLPLCIFGALIACFVHPWAPEKKSSSYHHFRHPRNSGWSDLKAYAGLILDAFLFPQIIFNIFCASKQTALALPYYVGATVVRMLPHAYDLFRSQTKLQLWYIYANPRMDFYSTSWDIIISCCCLLFAILVYLQQRFGGSWVLPSRLRPTYHAYDKVPAALADNK